MSVKKSNSVRKIKINPVNRKRKTVKNSSKLKIIVVLIILTALIFSPLYYGKIVKTAVSTSRWFRDLFVFDEYPKYEKFGIKIPRKYYLHGIDVSSYQGKIDWKKVSQMEYDGIKISFSFVKATEGVTLVDSYYQRNWLESKQNNVIRGAYHYFKPLKSGLWQAKFMMQTINLEAGDLPPVIDIEETGGLTDAVLIANIQEFANEIERKTKYKPIIYSGLRFYQDHLKGKFDDYPLWIAHYYQPKLKVSDKTNWYFWQHADNAHIDGINGRVDMNVFKGEVEDLSSFLIQKTNN
jgi:lysozyme